MKGPAGPPVPPRTVVAIDGPAGSGKSTTARLLAQRLGLLYVDTGAMYRALTWAALEAGVSCDDEAGLVALLSDADLELDTERQETRVRWNGRDLGDRIRAPEVEQHVSAVASHAAVRADMVARQRALGRARGVVMEGRDIGTAVFPLASAKIYLDASLEARAERRMRQHQRRGQTLDFETVLHEVEERDRLDSERDASPLTIPPDAVVVDNSRLSLDEQLERTVAAVRRVLAEQAPQGQSPDCISLRLTFRYRLAYAVFNALGRFFGLRVHGREHVLFDAGKIVAANHISNWDPPFLAAALRNQGSMRAVAKAELFKGPIGNAVFRFLDAIPIKRSVYDADAFDFAASVLERGQNIVFFPEGMRRVVGSPGPVRSGLGMLMQRTGAPAVPVFFRGTVAPVPGGDPQLPLEAEFAPPVRLRALPVLRQRMDEKAVNRLIGRLFEAIYRELQERSYARAPLTEREREQARRSAAKVRAKERKTFRRIREERARKTPGTP